MFCAQCGIAISASDKFCSKCGTTVSSAHDESTAQPSAHTQRHIEHSLQDGSLASELSYDLQRKSGPASQQANALAEQGNAKEQYNLGIMYADAQGVTQDYQEALKWFRLSAAQGSSEAQGELGYMYQGGQGVPQDSVQAMMWYLIAKAGGSTLVEQSLQQLESISAPAQIAEAQRMAREWRTGYDATLSKTDEKQPEQSGGEIFVTKATLTPEVNPAKNNTLTDNSAQATGSSAADLYEAVIGEQNKAYYLAYFDKFDQQERGLKASWNWPAFFFGSSWMLYRKMYAWFIAYVVIGIIISGVVIAIAISMGVKGNAFIAQLIMMAASGIFANSLYHNNIKKKIAVAQLTMNDEPKLLEHLRYKGGVNTWVIWVSSFIGIFAAIAIPQYHDYQKRASATQSQSQNPVAQDWSSVGTPVTPPVNQNTGTTPKPWKGYNINAARANGITDTEIAEYLATQHGFDINGARAEGYSDTQIANHLAARK